MLRMPHNFEHLALMPVVALRSAFKLVTRPACLDGNAENTQIGRPARPSFAESSAGEGVW